MRGLAARLLVGFTTLVLVFGLLATAASADPGKDKDKKGHDRDDDRYVGSGEVITAASPDDGGIPDP